jgi:hypothetical protein
MYQKEINGYRIYGKRGSYKLNTEKKYIAGLWAMQKSNGKALLFVSIYLQSNNSVIQRS